MVGMHRSLRLLPIAPLRHCAYSGDAWAVGMSRGEAKQPIRHRSPHMTPNGWLTVAIPAVSLRPGPARRISARSERRSLNSELRFALYSANRGPKQQKLPAWVRCAAQLHKQSEPLSAFVENVFDAHSALILSLADEIHRLDAQRYPSAALLSIAVSVPH